MIITVMSLKGGVGKTTTAVHLAAQLQQQASTVLMDADPNQSAMGWAKRGKFPFAVVGQWQPLTVTPAYDHVVIDTPARPKPEELSLLAESCELMVLPTTPDVLALDALVILLEQLKHLNVQHYRILLTLVPPKPNRDVEQMRSMLVTAHLPVFNTSIRNFAAFQKAAQAGVLVQDIRDPRAEEAWQDYQQVGQEIFALFGL